MDYDQCRTDILKHLNGLQRKGYSYQLICDHINSQQSEFVLFRDFFSRFQSKPNHFRGQAKNKKLILIHHHLQHLYFQKINEKDTINELLSNTISNAAAFTFETLLEVGRSEKPFRARLSEYYFPDSPAYLNIENNLDHKNQYGWELDIHHYGSTFEILSTETSSLFSQSAVVASKEFWKLFWVDKKSKKLQFKFESLGEKTYLLSKDDKGIWKIIEAMTNTPTNRLEPEYIDYLLLKQLSSSIREENKATASKFIAENGILHCIEFIKIIFSEKLPGRQISILHRIRESCLNSHRLLNTGVINFSTFNAEIELLKKQIILICDSIFLTNK